MTRDEQLREKFIDWLKTHPGGPLMLEAGFLDTATGQHWLALFTAGANAAIDPLVQPDAVRFAAPSENPTPRQSRQDRSGSDFPRLPPEYGGEG